MTPQFTPGSYVRAVQIFGDDSEERFVGRVGTVHDNECVLPNDAAYVKFPGINYEIYCAEVEPSTRADYNADWPEEQPEMSAKDHTDAVLESILGVGPDAFPLKTASAVLTAGNDHCLKYLRAELNHAEHQIKYETERLEIARDRVDAAKTRENAILDLIAARMDQLKGSTE